MNSATARTLLLVPALLALNAAVASAQVTDWFIYKERVYRQTADNTAPGAPYQWWAGAIVEVSSPGDAGSVTISGGGISGSLPLTYVGSHWEAEQSFPSQAAMNALIPDSTSYTLTLTGGTLGTLVQTVALGPGQYPNKPYLTGRVWSDVLSYAADASFDITWSNPGPLTQASGLTLFDINGDFGRPFAQQTMGVARSALVPAGTLGPTLAYEGYLTFTSTDFQAPGGFGVGGASHHGVSLEFDMQTLGTTYCTAGTTQNGCRATMSGSGTPRLGGGPPFVITTSGVEGNKNGIVFYGINGRSASPWGAGSSSYLCVKAPTQRTSLQNSGGTPGQCNGSFALDWNAYVASHPLKAINQALTLGTRVHAQAWFRDPGSPKNTSLSDALEFTVNP